MRMILTSLMVAMLAGLACAAEESNEEWLNKHAVIKTTELLEQDGSGGVKSVKTIKDTTVYIKQVVTEIRRPDKDGNLKLSSRVTTSSDTLGGSIVIAESMVAGKLVTTSITLVEITPAGIVTTVSSRDKVGNMVVVGKTTSVVKNNGNSPVIPAL